MSKQQKEHRVGQLLPGVLCTSLVAHCWWWWGQGTHGDQKTTHQKERSHHNSRGSQRVFTCTQQQRPVACIKMGFGLGVPALDHRFFTGFSSQGTDNSASINFCSIGTCATSTAAIGKAFSFLPCKEDTNMATSCRRFTAKKDWSKKKWRRVLSCPNSASDLTRPHGKFEQRWSRPCCSVSRSTLIGHQNYPKRSLYPHWEIVEKRWSASKGKKKTI